MIKICGTGSALPARTVTNDDLSKIMDTSDEWISSRTGIRARHLAVEETTTGMSVEAAKQALEEAGLQPEKLDLIIAATLSPDHVLPTLACEVQAALDSIARAMKQQLKRFLKDSRKMSGEELAAARYNRFRKF